MKKFTLKLATFAALVLALQALVSLSWERDARETARPVFSLSLPWGMRVLLPDPDQAQMGPEIEQSQQWMRTHPQLGFIWQPDIDTTDNVVLQWGDVPAGALSTDSFGFTNLPQAIALRKAGTPVDIVGVGASYMGGAQGLFHEYFWLKGLFYYNMAHGRFTLPLYNEAIRTAALPLKPRWIVYGLNEVPFHLIDDYEQWRRSGLDWFAFHSGSWCGPARKTGVPYDQLRAVWRPAFALYVAMEKKLSRKSLDRIDEKKKQRLIERSVYYVREAFELARANDVNFVVLFIPDKARMIGGPSPKNRVASWGFEAEATASLAARLVDFGLNWRIDNLWPADTALDSLYLDTVTGGRPSLPVANNQVASFYVYAVGNIAPFFKAGYAFSWADSRHDWWMRTRAEPYVEASAGFGQPPRFGTVNSYAYYPWPTPLRSVAHLLVLSVPLSFGPVSWQSKAAFPFYSARDQFSSPVKVPASQWSDTYYFYYRQKFTGPLTLDSKLSWAVTARLTLSAAYSYFCLPYREWSYFTVDSYSYHTITAGLVWD